MGLKKIGLSLICCLLASFAFSQRKYKPKTVWNYQEVDRKWIHFGFTLAMNQMDFAIYNSGKTEARTEQVSFTNDFSVGVISDLRLHENWSLRFLPGLEFGSRTIAYSNLPHEEVNVESVLINLPLLLKYKAKRLNNYRPYLLSGISYKKDVHSQHRLDPANKILIRLKTNDFYVEIGAGIDFYLPYFKLSTELKLSLGLRDILNHKYDSDNPGYEDYTDAIQKMNSQIVTLSFHFE